MNISSTCWKGGSGRNLHCLVFAGPDRIVLASLIQWQRSYKMKIIHHLFYYCPLHLDNTLEPIIKIITNLVITYMITYR